MCACTCAASSSPLLLWVPLQLSTTPGSTGDTKETSSKRTARLSWPPAKRRRMSDGRYKEGVHWVIHWPSLLALVFKSCPCLPPGEPSLRKRPPVGALQDQPSAKRVVRSALTGSEGTVEALGVSSSAPVVSGGAVAAERSPPICEGELSSPSVRLGWNRPCLYSLRPPPSLSMVFSALS